MKFITPVLDVETMRKAEVTATHLDSFFKIVETSNLRESPTLTLGEAFLDRIQVENYTSVYVSKFYIDGDLIITFADGYSLNVSAMIADSKSELEKAHG